MVPDPIKSPACTTQPEEVAKDRRHALLSLTTTGRAAYDNLSMAAAQFDRKLQERLGGDDVQALKRCLRALMKNP